jgi:hypothetical protein
MQVNSLYSYPYLNQQKTLGPSYYFLYSLFKKISDEGKIVSARYQGVGGEREGLGG